MLLWRRRLLGTAAVAAAVVSLSLFVCVCCVMYKPSPLCESVCAAVINSSV